MTATVKDVPVMLTTDEVIEIHGDTYTKTWAQDDTHTVKYYLKQSTWILSICGSDLRSGDFSCKITFILPSEKSYTLTPSSEYEEQPGRILPKGSRMEVEFTYTGGGEERTIVSSLVVRRY